jgi:peptidoglycan-N-acetylglucosamine deacetylase
MQITNFMSVDLEDYYCDLPISKWPNYQERVVKNTRKILELFNQNNVKATFFTLGYIAEKFPDLIHEIVEQGHEIGSHTYAHLDLRKNSKEVVTEDIKKSVKVLKDISGQEILGFRAPYFSINEKSFWVFDLLEELFVYDSSIFPVKTPLYGISNAPRTIYKPTVKNPITNNEDGKLIEIPAATHKFPIYGNVPIAGGFYLRFLPYFYIKYGIKSNHKNKNPVMMYIHPKDIDPQMPKIKGYNWYYYYNLKKSFSKFEQLLQDFKFSSVKNILKI